MRFIPVALLLSLCLTHALHAQTLSGTIVDRVTEAPLAGASVVYGSGGTATDAQGRFTLAVDSLPALLEVTYLGYQPLKVPVRQSPVRIALEAIPLSLDEIVVSAGSVGSSILQTPAGITLVSPEMLRRDDPFAITNSLNRVPGVYLHSGTMNTQRLTIRGIGSRSLYGTNKIKAYYDDIPLTDGSGNSSLEDVDQSLIGRMEVIKGPNSSIYGGGLGGTVRLQSARPETLETSATAGFTAGSFGSYRSLASLAHHQSNLSLQATYTDTRREGFRENSQYSRQQAALRTHYYLSDKSYIALVGIFTRMEAFIPSSINENDFRNAPQKAAFTWAQARGYEAYDKGLGGITWQHALGRHTELKATVFGNYRDAYEPRPFDILAEQTRSVGSRTTVSQYRDQLQWTAGVEVFRDRYAWQLYENDYTATSNGSVQGAQFADYTEDRAYSNWFAEASYQWGKWRAVAGANLNLTRYALADRWQPAATNTSGSYTYTPQFSPRLGVSYRLHPRHSAYANISHGFSAPGLDETLYPNGQINPDIRPETGWNYEVGARGETRRWVYDLSIYYMHIAHLLVAQRTADDQYVGVNAGTNQHLGVDARINYHLPLTGKTALDCFASGALMHYRFAEFVHNDNNYAGNQLTGVPRLLLNPGIELSTPAGLYGNVNGQYTGAIPITDANDLYTDPYWLLRARLGYRRTLGPLTLDLYGGADNLTDTHYASMLLINATGIGTAPPRYYYPGTPRNWYGGVQVKWVLRGK